MLLYFMKRSILLLLVYILTGWNVQAASREEKGLESVTDTIINYFDNLGNSVSTKAESRSYQYIVSIGNDSEKLFNIVSYYADTDSMKSFGYSRDSTASRIGWKYIGDFTTYYPNGQLKSLETFDIHALPIDSSYYYYPTGKLKMLVTQVESGQSPFVGIPMTKPYYLLYLDSIGNYLLKRGNGFLRLDYDDGTYIEGELKDNEREGKWNGWNMGSQYEELYLHGTLQSGKRFRATGEVISYDAETKEIAPMPPLKMDQYMKAIYKNIKIPNDLVNQLKSEATLVKFVVNKDGHLSKFTYDKDVPMKIRSEITTAIQRIGSWEPGRLQGEPVAVSYTIPVRL